MSWSFGEIGTCRILERLDPSDYLTHRLGRILANVWYEDTIIVINPETGIVEKEYGT